MTNMYTQLDLFSQVITPHRWATPVFRLELVRERELDTPFVTTPSDVALLFCDYLARCDREHLVVAMFTAANQLIGLSTVHIGALTTSLASVRDSFKTALIANAASIVIGHNHPSGSTEPSREDIAVSKRLAEAGKLMEIPLMDSLIIGYEGKYTSLVERGLL